MENKKYNQTEACPQGNNIVVENKENLVAWDNTDNDLGSESRGTYSETQVGSYLIWEYLEHPPGGNGTQAGFWKEGKN